MKNNFIMSTDNVFSKKECNYIIKNYKPFLEKDKTKGAVDRGLYNFYDINAVNFIYYDRISDCLQQYVKKYPEINLTASYWGFTYLRFKVWKKGDFYNVWHSEHCIEKPNRILNIQIYLTDHDCGTEFYNGELVSSKAGRVTFFPAYFTHTHRGQPDLKKDRWLITGYIEFIGYGDKEEINEK